MAQQNELAGPSISETFESYFNNWLNSKQVLLDQLLAATSPENAHKIGQHKNLIDQVLAHYRNYFEEKSRAQNQDVFIFFSPPWFTSFERALLWLGEFKPSMIFRLISGFKDLTAEQSGRIEQIKLDTRRQERELTDAMARIQESIAAGSILSLTRQLAGRRALDGEVSRIEEAIEELKAAMLALFEGADGLRGSTAANVMEGLRPIQNVVFLGAAIQFQLRVRRWGLRERGGCGSLKLNTAFLHFVIEC